MGYRKTGLVVHDSSRPALRRYQELVVGSSDLWYTLKFELLTGLFGSLPGALGLLLRNRFYPRLFRHVGRGVVFGRNLTLLHPNKISIGDNVVIGDRVSLGARGDAGNEVLIGNGCVIGRGVVVESKFGRITIGNQVKINRGASIGSIVGSEVRIDDHVLIAPFAYIGGAGYRADRVDLPIALQGLLPRGGITIGSNARLGIRCLVLDGSSVGRDAVVGDGAVVTHDVPPSAVVAGIPARYVGMREGVVEAGMV